MYYIATGTMSLDVINPRIVNYNGMPTVNTASGTVFAASVFSGCKMYASSSNLKFDLKMEASVPSSSVYRVKMTSGIPETVYVYHIYTSILAFNLNDAVAEPWPALAISYNTFKPGSPYQDTNGSFQDYNTFWGVTWFNVNNQPSLEWSTTLTTGSSVSASSENPFNNL